MIIIGEKINGAIKSVAEAIAARDASFISQLAKDQEAAGANYIDVCAGTQPNLELDALIWLIETVQEAVSVPLCIDSPRPETLIKAIPYAKQKGLINSVSNEGSKPSQIFPLIKEYGWDIIALTIDDKGIPADTKTRVDIARILINEAAKYGIAQNRIYIDPLVMALSTDTQSLIKFIGAMEEIRSEFSEIKFTSGLSNISFGMPKRKMVNNYFLALAVFSGMDSAILNPLDKEIIGAIYSVEALMGKDRLCRSFNNAFRKGLFN